MKFALSKRIVLNSIKPKRKYCSNFSRAGYKCKQILAEKLLSTIKDLGVELSRFWIIQINELRQVDEMYNLKNSN